MNLNPFFTLLGMYVGFAALLLGAGFTYKTLRDKRDKRNKIEQQTSFDYDREESRPRVVAR